MARLRILVVLCLLSALAQTQEAPKKEDMHLTTNAQGYLTVIQGFAAQLQCMVNTCAPNVNWYKDDLLLFNGTKFQKDSPFKEESYLLEHAVEVNHANECTGTCSDSDSSSCGLGTSCIDNQCCPCSHEHYTLVLRNLTFDDSGRYKCQLGAADSSELLEFQVEVLESGLKGGFHENISYDHSECCEKKGISPLCRAMCKPSDMDKYHYDPTSCKTDDYKHFLSCATDNGNRSHVHCCKTQLVPSFCYDLCSNEFTALRRSHRLCLYYLPEIFDCYNRAYLPFPDPPEDVVVNAVEADKLEVCWKPPKPQKSNANYPVIDYTVFYKQIPSFPFLGGEDGVPLLGADYGDSLGDADYVAENESVEKRRKREVAALLEDNGIEIEQRKEIIEHESGHREKRQTWVFVTRDDASNSSAVREFSFSSLNTTETCATISDLRSATRYIVYVTARNGYGASVPSVRSIASTNIHTVTSNSTLPDAQKCCNENGVSDYCGSKMCAVNADPTSMNIITIATTCRHEWPKVSPCIADGRNHTECCLRKGVQNDCLNICNGRAETLGVHSVLCLNLDLAAIYQCLREGYETHPSPPVNVTVRTLTEHSATVTWAEPETNAHLVETYTLFIRKNEHGALVRTITNALSPHTESDLDPDSSYAVSVQSHSEKGTSLPSTTVLFQTMPDVEKVCTYGDPLYMNNGRPFMCGLPSNPCPMGFTCTPTDNDDEAFCCPNPPSSMSFEPCCRKGGVPDDCISSCSHNATSLPESCGEHINPWLRCASDGHDHSRCCDQEEISKECITACRHPFTVSQSCVAESTKLARCFAQHHSRLPLAVRNLQLTSLDATSADLAWDHTLGIDTYEVQMFHLTNLVGRINTTTASYHMPDLSPSSAYAVRVIAFNAAGSSPPSFNLTFSTLPEKDEEGDRPLSPKGVKIAWNRGSSVNITWTPVTQRRNGDEVKVPIIYTVFFLDQAELGGSWVQIKTNKTWAVMSELRRDALYNIYVIAAEGEGGHESRASSVITMIAQADAFGLPEPEIAITPSRLVYAVGDKFVANCSVDPGRMTDDKLNLDLQVDEVVHEADPGASFVVVNVTATKMLDTLTCVVSTTDGRQNVALKHVMVSYGPIVKMEHERVRAFDDLSAEITCIAEGFPAPTVHFEFKEKPFNGEVHVRSRGSHAYGHTLVIRNATGHPGFYKCIAEHDGVKVEASAELVVSSGALLPVNPRLVQDCCEEGGVTGGCLAACTVGRVPHGLNCTAHAPALLKCANDQWDHTDCCRELGVSSRCISLCSGDSFSTDVDCGRHAADIMSCFVRGHKAAPSPPMEIRYMALGGGRVKITWDTGAPGSFQYYAVYYRKLGLKDDSDFELVKVQDPWVELALDGKSEYEIGIAAVNSYGPSRAEIFALDSRSSTRSSSGGFWAPLFIFGLIIAVCGAGWWMMSKRRRGDSVVWWRNGANRPNDPTVSFENPGYGNDLGDEVEIRGLGSVNAGEWQRTELQAADTRNASAQNAANAAAAAASSSNGSAAPQNGMRYSKMPM